jgi:hypothetical protein
MYNSNDRLTMIAMPRIVTIGVPGKSFDGRGNFAMGLKEHIVFPKLATTSCELGTWISSSAQPQTTMRSKIAVEALQHAVQQLKGQIVWLKNPSPQLSVKSSSRVRSQARRTQSNRHSMTAEQWKSGSLLV